MDKILELCSTWSKYELDYLFQYVESRNKVKLLTPEEIDSNVTYRALVYNPNDGIEVDSPEVLHAERSEYLSYIYFWLSLMSSENSSVIDLACFKNEMEVFLEDLTSFNNAESVAETVSNHSEEVRHESEVLEDTTVPDLPSKRPRLDEE